MNPAHNQAIVYVLNHENVPEDRFGWAEAFETWRQRRGAHVVWTHEPTPSNEWCATATFGANVINGTGATIQEARKNAVINIERANILH
ncbi:unnamed protein product [Rhizoctonia solani]|uniref:Uncharacterized protein n=1 Tax=Rhizoctonia solani TaxID=456999 RepID=A0A8H2W900_9AGAM|nr:unnamed protein product [Rhizoctonia solani]